ncbi:MAG: hypothetical protein ABI321_08960 [Polyangia bacterium]
MQRLAHTRIAFLVLALSLAACSGKSSGHVGQGHDGGDTDAAANSDLQAISDLSMADAQSGQDQQPGCSVAPVFTWRAAAITDTAGKVHINVVQATNGGLTGELVLYVGDEADLMSLPKVRTIQGTIGQPTVDGSFVVVDGKSYGLLSATITLNYVTSPLSSEIKASLSDLVFQETACVPTQNDMSSSCTTGYVAGCTFTAPASTLDTTVANGTACASSTDCGTNGKVCDVMTSLCASSECSSDTDCGTNKLCVTQHAPVSATDGVIAKACYAKCNPLVASSCGTSATCIRPIDRPPTMGDGICLSDGPGAASGPCSQQVGSNSTGCTTGSLCVGVGFGPGGQMLACRATCDPFMTDPGCGAGSRCFNGICAPAAAGVDAAALGQPCTATNSYCADDGKAYRGFCANPFGMGLMCRPFCELGSVCSSGSCTAGGGAPLPSCI